MVANREDEAKPSRRAQRRAQARVSDESSAGEGEGEAESEAAPAGDEAQERAKNRQERRAEAAKRRRERFKERERARNVGLSAEEMVDDAVARFSDRAFKWMRRNFNVLQWVIVLGIVGWVAYLIYAWRATQTEAKGSNVLAAALEADLAPVTQADTADEILTFKTEEARIEAALKAYDKALEANQSEGATLFAQLGKAGVLYEQGKYDEAQAGYEAVRSAADGKGEEHSELLGRALEGLALVYEAKGDTEAALDAYKRLKNTDKKGFKELGSYHEARLLTKLDKRDEAKEILEKLLESIRDDPLYAPGSYLHTAASALLTSLAPDSPALTPTGGSPEQLQKLIEQMQSQMNAAPAEAPATPEPVQPPQSPPSQEAPAAPTPAPAPNQETKPAPETAAPKAPAPKPAAPPKAPAPKAPAAPPKQADPPAQPVPEPAPAVPKAPAPAPPKAPPAGEEAPE